MGNLIGIDSHKKQQIEGKDLNVRRECKHTQIVEIFVPARSVKL